MLPLSDRARVLRRVFPLAAALALSLLSCGREITGPDAGIRWARGLSFDAQFPEGVRSADALSSGLVDFDRVRVVFLRSDNTAALDRVVAFPSTSDSVAVSFDIPLTEGAGAAGEPMALTLAYVNAAGDTVFRGGPTQVLVTASRAGEPAPAPFSVALTFTGQGSNATRVAIAPETLTVVAGSQFAFSATASDADAAPVPTAPIAWLSLDSARAAVTSNLSGSGTARESRGEARVVARLLNGPADTAILVVTPRPGSLAAVPGTPPTAPALGTVPVTVRVNATDGLPMAGVAVAFAVSAGGGSVSAASAISDASGDASISWTLGPTVGAQSLTASSAGLASVVVATTATAVGPTQLIITQQPAAAQVAGATVTPPLVVEVRDANDALVDTYADSVVMAFAANPGNDTLSGISRVVAVGGVATFDAWHLRRAASGYTITASAAGLSSATTTPITVSAAAADSLLLQSGGGQTGAAGAALAQLIVIRVSDAYGNPVAGATVNFAVALGSVSVTEATTDASGLASATWTLGTAAGTQTLTVTSGELTGSPLAVTATVGAGVVSTTVTPALDTLTAIGATRLLTAESRDVEDQVVAGSYTWESRTTAVATVASDGRVTAVTNGGAWVVVTEAGGTRDSTLIVVDQRLATIDVAPNPRDIYLGASFPFVATAVDGLGVPLVVQPTFTWGTQSSAIASITSDGVATGVGLGSTQVQATASGVTGVGVINVRTPITRIAVVRDSLTFVATDTFSLAALQATRSYRAVAYDTLDAPMTGIAFAWASSNPSVASLDSTGTITARARAAANGFTAIRASAQGITGAAALTVAQVMTAVELTPASVTVAPTGSVVLTPRRRDANGFFIPGGSFTFATADAGIATVSATGVVVGVAVGGTTVSATSGTIISPPTTVTVGNDVPAIISFGRDTLAIGRSATNVPIPVYLSRPNANPVTVALAVADTFAAFNPLQITIPSNATVGTATLNGRNAGTTRVFAIDVSQQGFAGDTAMLAVQAGARFTNTGYSLLVNDQLSTQVILTDPSPAGGTFVTYNFGTTGRVSVSPEPAFIPAGQLSADVVLRALSAGGSTVTPVATGVNGTTSTVSTLAPTLTMYRPTARIGAGQYRNDWYVYTPQNVNVGFPVSLTSTDSLIARVTSQATVPAGSYYSYFTVTGRTPGAVTVNAAATGWTSPSQSVVITTPKLYLTGGGTLNTTSPQTTLTVYSADSANGASWRSSALAVTMSSSNESVIQVQTSSFSIGADQYYSSAARVIPGGAAGTAWVRVTASGHIPDSVQYTVVGPQLRIYQPVARVGAGQYRPDAYVYTPNTVTTPLVVRLSATNAAVAGVPDSIVIPANTYYAYFNQRGLNPGTTRIHATAVGYQPDSVNFQVTTPEIQLAGGGTLNNFTTPAVLTTYPADTVGGVHYRSDTLIISYVSSDPSVVSVTAADTVRPGQYYTQGARATVVGEGTAWVHATAPGHRPDSVQFIIVRPRVQFSFTTYRIGRRQYRTPTDFYVSTPNTVTAPLEVTITQTNAAIDSLTSNTLTIGAGSYYAYFGLAGLETGVDTLIASAPGFLPDTAVVIITSPRFTGGTIPGTATTTTPPSAVTIYTADSVGGVHYSLDTLLIAATSSNDAVLQPDSAGFRLPRGAYYVQPRVRWVGPGTASVTYRDSLNAGATGYGAVTSNSATVTGPSLTFSNSYPVLGMRQYRLGTGAYVTIPNAIGAPLTVDLVSTDPAVATVPASVTIPAGQTLAYVDVRAQSQVGTVQLQATAVGYGGANTTQQVTAPRFTMSVPATMRTTQAPAAVTILATDANGSAHYVWEPVTVSLTSSNPGAATVDSASVVIPAGGYLNNSARVTPVEAGTTTLSATDARVESWRYGDASAAVAIVTPSLTLSWGGNLSLGIGQYTEGYYVYVPDNQATPLTVNLSHLNASSTTTESVVIPAASYYVYHRISGAAAGTDNITYTAAGHTPVVGAVVVGSGRTDMIGGWPTNLASDSVQVTLYARDPAGNARNVTNATTFDIAIAGAFLEAASGGVPVTSVTIPAGGQSVSFYLRRVANGASTVTFTNANYQTNVAPVVTVSGAP